jgi:DNA gyrase inhibitor GyrI
MAMKLILVCVGIVLLLVLITGCKLTRHGYESANYTVVQEDGAFEIRDYPDLTLVSTSMNPSNAGGDDSFMRLFRYISGANENEQKISMTVPVFSETINAESGRMSFLVPSKVAEEGTPNASSDDVQIKTMRGGRFATYRFSGRWDVARQQVASEKLAEWMKLKSLETSGQTLVAGYDPPFTPPFMRRNEILIRIPESHNGNNIIANSQ